MNVVFVVLDTVRRDVLSPYNDEIACTDHLERFADEGTVFENAVAQAPWTLPSHGSMFTGLYPWEHGATQTNLDLDVEHPLLAERLQAAGYETACFSANPFVSERFGTADGFDEVETTVGRFGQTFDRRLERAITAFEERVGLGAVPKIESLAHRVSYRLKQRGVNDTERLMDEARSFVRDNRDDDFFLFMNLMDCHLPLFPDPEYKQRHAPDVHPGLVNQYAHRVMFSDEEPESEALRKLYTAQIDYLDDQVGELLSFLDDEALTEDTVVVVAGDHGENLGEDGLLGHSFSVNENLVHVPLLVKSPDLEDGRVERQVELRELYEFLLSQTGLDDSYRLGTEYAMGGEDTPALDLAKIPPAERSAHDAATYYVRTNDRKGILTSDGEYTEVELREDAAPDEEIREKLEEIDGSYDDSQGRTVEDVDEDVKDRLEELGYA